MSLPCFRETSFEHEGVTKTVYRRGSGPGVILTHELPGLIPEDAALGRRIADAGFTVFMPSLIGTDGKRDSLLYDLEGGARLCISREFNMLATRTRSPITEWVRALARSVHAEIGGRGVGAIGMCLTGNFALALMLDPTTVAPVLSQPALPASWTRAQRAALQLSDDELRIVKERARGGTRVLGLRFTCDALCPKERFDRLSEELGDAFERIDIDSSEGNSDGLPRSAHSVLTRELIDCEGHPTRKALDRLIGFLRENLVQGS